MAVAWQRIFQITFLVGEKKLGFWIPRLTRSLANTTPGLVSGFVLYTIISLVFPPPHRTTHEEMDMGFDDSSEVIEGMEFKSPGDADPMQNKSKALDV